MSSSFLTAEWKNLAIANYVIDKEILMKYLPYQTELDMWNDQCIVSLVGFMFQNTKLMGVKVPFHIHFEEVNLRFYVKHLENGVWKRGVVFIKEIVPKHALTWVANTVYKEHYQTMPMKHHIAIEKNSQKIEYAWKHQSKWHSFQIETNLTPQLFEENSEEEFITEHYWGYTKLGSKKTSEYGVEHPKWRVYKTLNHQISVDFAQVYGHDFEILNHIQPVSIFLAEGSPISVKRGRIIQ